MKCGHPKDTALWLFIFIDRGTFEGTHAVTCTVVEANSTVTGIVTGVLLG